MYPPSAKPRGESALLAVAAVCSSEAAEDPARVDALAGSVVFDQESVLRVIAEGGVRSIWREGAITVQLRASDYARPLVAEKGRRR
jgi:hypothetical protein